MQKNKVSILASCVLLSAASSFCQFSLTTQSGSSSLRSIAMGNTGVVSSTDRGALLDNPALLAYLPKRELSAAVSFMNETAIASILNNSEPGRNARFLLDGIGLVHAIPTTRGGLTLGFAIENPTRFSYIDNYSYTAARPSASVLSLVNNSKVSGNLTYWSMGAGIQLSEKISAGVTASLITGQENTYLFLEKKLNNVFVNSIDSNYDAHINRKYFGYALRGGISSQPLKNIQLGMMIAFPHTTSFDKTHDETNVILPDIPYSYSTKGKLTHSLEVDGGGKLSSAFGELAVALHVRTPYDFFFSDPQVPSTSSAAQFKIRASVGGEVPLAATGLLLRAGYVFSEVDPFVFVEKIDSIAINWNPSLYLKHDYLQEFTAGMASVQNGITWELAYRFAPWDIAQKTDDGTFTSAHQRHTFTGGMSISY